MLNADDISFTETTLSWPHTFRIISSRFPPVNFFEKLVDPQFIDELFFIESLTNDRIREELGNISLVPKEDCVYGKKGASIIMAAFTHISRDRPSRFSDGTFGVYYASQSITTSIRETAYHRERFLKYTQEPACELTMRVYRSGKILQPLKDIRNKNFASLHHSEDYTVSQAFGKKMKETLAWGIVYNSVRHRGSLCIAILRPTAIALPVIQTKHLRYMWNGEKIEHVYEVSNELIEI